ncbi:MAG: CHAT domain-containing protein [Pseudanabaena sp. ELA645]|jgi:hypothetical protein
MPKSPIKILILTANPSNTERLHLDQEVRGIEDELLRSQSRDSFEMISKWAVRVDDLSRAMLDYNPAIVHFSGHGGGEEGLALEDDDGKLQLVQTEPLAKLFKLTRNTIKCVILNACYSQVQAVAIHQHIDCVIGMNRAIGDKAAIQFSSKFYQALAKGCSFQYAYDFACTVLDLSGSNESTTPTLLNRNEAENPLAIATSIPETQPVKPEPLPKHQSQQSQSIGNITISGSNNPFAVIQSGGDVTLSQKISQTTGGNALDDLEVALSLLGKLKQDVAATETLSAFVRKDTESKISMLQEALQQPKPDHSFVNEVMEALKQALSGVLTFAEPVTQVATLVAKAWARVS